jgi:hypothetical protein
VSRDCIAHWGFPVTMALPASIFNLLDIWGVAILYHGSTCIGCLRGSFRNSRASCVVFSEPLVYWPTFPRLPLANIWILPNPGSYAWAHFFYSTWSYFNPCARMTTLSSLRPFFLVLNHFHWFNFVQKLVFSEVAIIFVPSSSDFLFAEPDFELRSSFDGTWDGFVLSLPSLPPLYQLRL